MPHLRTFSTTARRWELFDRHNPPKRTTLTSPVVLTRETFALSQNLWFALRAGFSAGALNRARCIPALVVAQAIVVARYNKSFGATCENLKAQRNAYPRALPVPRRLLRETQFSGKTMGRWRLNPPAHDFIETGSPVTSFVCASVPGTTRSTHPPLRLPCRSDTPLLALRRRHWGPGIAWS